MKNWFRFFSFFRKKKAIILVDWENMFINLGGRKEFTVDAVIQAFLKLKEQISQLINGEVIGIYIFASSHSAFLSVWEKTFYKLNFPVISCPKISDGMRDKNDTVDETLMREGSIFIRNMGLTHLCVATGDADFIPLYEEAHALGLKTLTIYASLDSLASELIGKTDKPPIKFPSIKFPLTAD